jgi:hypothetical protein
MDSELELAFMEALNSSAIGAPVVLKTMKMDFPSGSSFSNDKVEGGTHITFKTAFGGGVFRFNEDGTFNGTEPPQ